MGGRGAMHIRKQMRQTRALCDVSRKIVSPLSAALALIACCKDFLFNPCVLNSVVTFPLQAGELEL